MKIIHVKVNIHQDDDPDAAAVPVAVPDLVVVRGLANRLHAEGREYGGMAWGWPVHYDPELREDAAEFDIPDGQGAYRTEIRPFWSPASFTIGESGIWFYSILWENGSDSAPVEFLDDRNALAYATQ
jgi:hypothetical protein